VGILDGIAHRLGYTPLTSELAAVSGEQYASRFSDNDHLADITLDDWLGALPDYIAVNRNNAMTVATVAASRHTIATTTGRLSLQLKKGGVTAPLQPQLLEQAERGVPMSTTMNWTVDSLFFYPCTWWVVTERDAYGWPIWVDNIVDRSRAGLDSEGRLITVDRKPVDPKDVIRFDSPLGDGFLRNARKNIQRAIALDLSAALAEDNPVPTVELHNEGGIPLDKDEREELLDNWQASRRRRGVAYTPKGLKVIPHGQAPQQLLIDGRRAISLDLIRQASMPAWAASTAIEGATMTYDNRSMRNWELIDLTLAPYFTAIAGRLSLADVTPRGSKVKVDVDELTRPDQKTRFETYKVGIDGGFIDAAWIEAQEGQPLKLGGSE